MDLRAGEGLDASAQVLGLVMRGGGGGSGADKRNGDETRAGNEVEFTVAVAGDSGDATTNERRDAGAAVLRDGEAFASGVRAEVGIASGEGSCSDGDVGSVVRAAVGTVGVGADVVVAIGCVGVVVVELRCQRGVRVKLRTMNWVV